ncbi:MAG: S8 family serine peptidase [Polyangiales bacterium]
MSTRSSIAALLTLASIGLNHSASASPRPAFDPAPVALTLPARGHVESAWLRPHLDRVRALVGADRARAADGLALTGRSVVIGVVDSGFDLALLDLRGEDGSTRVAWMLDYTESPRGAHPELEARFAVETPYGRRGSVRSGAELDAAISSGMAPDDPIGHGTHALSIALGGGGLAHRYAGIAPEAVAVVVRASLRRDRAEVPEAIAALGAAFVFDRAASRAMPAVVSLSLGTHRGAHDGDGPLERDLAALVDGGDARGRALVVSAGNGGGRALHARVELARGETVPLSLRLGAPYAGLVGVAIASRSPLAVTPRWPDGTEGDRVSAGSARSQRNPRDGARVSVSNALDGASPATGARVVDAVIDGPGGAYTLLLQGEGRVDAWIYLDGNATTARELPAFEAPYGDEGLSVEVPATSPSVVSVGALTTRAQWVDAMGRANTRTDAIEGTVARFSARGPSAVWALKPDLLAPGDVVIAALSSRAATSLTGPFSDPHLAVDATHAAASGTSAAAPQVAGALALLFEENPAATQRELVAALMSGDAPWSASTGWSTLDIPRALAALHRTSPRAPASALRSRCALPEGPVVRGERVVIACRVLDANGDVTDGSLATTVSAGRFEAPRALGLGRYALGYTAPETGDHVTFSVTLDGAPWTRGELALTAGPGTGDVGASGGCSASKRASRGGVIAVLLAWMFVWRSRGRRSVSRRVQCQ